MIFTGTLSSDYPAHTSKKSLRVKGIHPAEEITWEIHSPMFNIEKKKVGLYPKTPAAGK